MKKFLKLCSVCAMMLVCATVLVACGGHEHEWGEWVVTTPATYTEEGIETRVCANDATHTQTRRIEVLEKTTPSVVSSFGVREGLAGDSGKFTLFWSAPADNGGLPITGYQITEDNWATQTNKGSETLTYVSTSSVAMVDGKYTAATEGNTYTFKIKAVNSKGAGQESVIVVTIAKTFTSTVYLLTKDEGGRSAPVQANYKPTVLLDSMADVISSNFDAVDPEILLLGGTATVTITLGDLAIVYEGMPFVVKEGAKTVGTGTVLTAVPPTVA